MAKRVSKGCLYRRKGAWWFKVSVDGRAHYFALGTNLKREAERMVEEFRQQVVLGLDPWNRERLAADTLEDLVTEYRAWSERNKAPASRRRERSILTAFLARFGSKARPAAVTHAALDQYLAGMDRQPATLTRHLATIRHLYAKAVAWGVCRENPATNIRPFRVQKKPVRWLTDAEISRLLAAAPDDFWRGLILLALGTGLRGGEICRLTAADVDLAGGLLTVHHTKSYQVRHVPFSRRLVPVLEQRIAAGGDRLFPIGHDYVIHQVRSIALAAGLPGVTAHVLRHTYASRLIAGGLDLRTVQALMGHQSITTTMLYAHLSPDHYQAAAAVLEKAYAGTDK